MRTVDEEIDIEVNLIRDSGYFGELHVVPVVNQHFCFLYCGKGRCNCEATVAGKYCLVTDDKLKDAQKDFLNELHRLENKINKV